MPVEAKPRDRLWLPRRRSPLGDEPYGPRALVGCDGAESCAFNECVARDLLSVQVEAVREPPPPWAEVGHFLEALDL